MAGDILRRLRFGTRETRMVQKMIEAHLRLWQMGGQDGLPTRRAIYRYFRDTGDVSIDIMFLSLADFLATQGPIPDVEQWEQHCRLMDYILTRREEEATIVSPPKLIDGHDVMRVFGLKPGSRIGQILDAVREAQGAGEIDTREGALRFVRSYLTQGQTDEKVI
jgi:poly(A) polymerase